jgi:polyribonucleotide nucleotidyltransferase
MTVIPSDIDKDGDMDVAVAEDEGRTAVMKNVYTKLK